MGIVGTRVVRTEDPALLTGHATFVENLDIPGAVHVVYVRSQMAHARITAVDTAEAREMPGVLGVFTAADLDLPVFPIDIPFLPPNFPRTALASDTVSILSMELIDNGFILIVPGAMAATLVDGLFWVSLVVSLVIAFALTVPVNKWLMDRGKGHAAVHHLHEQHQH